MLVSARLAVTLATFLGASAAVASPLPPTPPASPTDALAQAEPALAPGITAGALNRQSPRWESGAPLQRFTFTGSADELVVLIARSSAFDTLLVLEGPDGFRVLNDDAPGLGVHSRLRTVLPAAGAYTVTVTSAHSSAEGPFTLDVERDAARPAATPAATSADPQAPRPLRDAASGDLAPGDRTLNSGEFYDAWLLEVAAGDRLLLHLDASSFDPYLIVRTPTGQTLENDDRAEGDLNATVDVTFPSAGTAQVFATSYQPGETGPYQLRVERAEPVNVTPRPLAADTWVEGRLSSADPTRHGGQHLQHFTFEGQRGQRIVLELESTDFDPTLTATGPGGFHEINDDIDYAAGNLNSRIRAALPADGLYTVEVSSWSAAATGAFRLRRTTGDLLDAGRAAPAEPLAPAASAAVEHRGALASGDTQLTTGEYFDVYEIVGQSGQTVTLSLESQQLDTYLIVQGPNGFQQDNDDVANTTNSRIELTFPTDGTYRVLATSFAPGELGDYVLTIQEGSLARANARGRVFAISVGISEYPTASHLPYCADDAVKLDESLRTTGLLTQESRVLTEGRATRDNIRAALADVARHAGPDDAVVFFFSGHGNQLPNAAELDGYDETIEAWDGAIRDDELAEWLDPIRARLTLVALDSCFSGGFARDIVTRPDRIGIFSSEEDVLSNVALRFAAGGYLSLFLREGLAGEADTSPRDGVITVGELTQYLRRQWADHMMAEAASTGAAENTWQNLVIDRGAVKVSDVVVYSAQGG